MATVAVITPIYATSENKRLELFEYTLRSVLRQNSSNCGIVHVVVDDGSTVDVEGLLKEHGDGRTRYVRRERSPDDLKTASNALNMGIDYCLERSGDVFTKEEADNLYGITFVHSDDLLARNSVEVRLETLSNGFVYTDMGLLNKKGKVIGVRSGDTLDKMNASQFNIFLFNYHTVMWKYDFLQYLKDFVGAKYEQPGVFDPQLYFGEDTDMVLSSIEAAAHRNYEALYLNEVSVLYRVHEQSISGESLDSLSLNAQHKRIYQKHFKGEIKNSKLELLAMLQADPPWSWFIFLSKDVKIKLKPIKYYVKGLTFKFQHPLLVRSLEQQLI